MVDEQGDAADDRGPELISRLRVIETQPLADRAAAYSALHDDLARRLGALPAENSDGSR